MKDRGQRIRDMRGRLGLSQDEFGERFGVTGRVVSAWERGESMPSAEFYEAVADRFPGEIRFLLGMEQDAHAVRESSVAYGMPAEIQEIARDLAARPRLAALVRRLVAADEKIFAQAEALAGALGITVEGAALVLMLREERGEVR